MPALFICGTETGVGKTVVTALLARALRSLGVDCVAIKPFASGCKWQDGALQSEDADFLQVVGGFTLPLELACPIRLELPLAPLAAAQQIGLNTREWPRTAFEAFEHLQRNHDWVLVEGVGGWSVPLWRKDDNSMATCADLVTDWQLPVVVVARRTLGTINHTTLTCRSVEQTAQLKGVIFCDAEPVANDDIAAQTSPHLACELAQTRELARIPFSQNWDAGADALKSYAQKLLSEATD